MIRFIDLRTQGTGGRFAFWDTVTDRFVELSGSQVWETLGEFLDDLLADLTKQPDGANAARYAQDRARFQQLCPRWAYGPATNPDEL